MKRILKLNLGVFTALLFLALATSALAADDYFIYANFNNANTGGVFQPGQACGGYAINNTSGNLYVARAGGQWCDVYLVTIPAGSDPNAHDDDPATGPMELRTLTLVGSMKISDYIGLFDPQANDFQVTSQYVYFGPSVDGGEIWQWDRNPANGMLVAGTHVRVVIADATTNQLQTLAYDEATSTFYAGNYARDIYSIPMGGTSWTPKLFTHPSYGGGHHDGLEYVGGFLWISDMTSDFIAKLENIGGTWTEIAVFAYSGDVGVVVEGMGFGPLGHFWATGWEEMYELGGGGLEVRIPTLTEWGMIIFCVLLFGWMAWVIVRRRRRVTANI